MASTRIENNTFILSHNGQDIKGSPLAGPPKFPEISSWCQGVRDYLASLEKDAAADKRARRPLEPPLREVEEGDWKPEYTRVKPDPELDNLDLQDAAEYVSHSMRIAKELMDKANKALVKAEKEYKEAHRKWLKWSQLAENFDGLQSEEDLHSGADEQRTPDELPPVLPGGGTTEP